MGCLVAIVAALSPRLALVLVWIFTNLVDRAFEDFLLPLLGLVFLTGERARSDWQERSGVTRAPDP